MATGAAKTAWMMALGAALALLVVGLVRWLAAPQPGLPVQLSPPPSPPPLVVYVSGAVTEPGVYSLPAGSRVRDLIQAAGGLLPEADDQSLNLAALLQDGQRVIAPFRPTPAPTRDPSQPLPAGKTPTLQVIYPLNINSATQAELETLPGIGPVTAQNILAYRQEHGPFQAVEELDQVPGIGPVTLENLKPLVTVGP